MSAPGAASLYHRLPPPPAPGFEQERTDAPSPRRHDAAQRPVVRPGLRLIWTMTGLYLLTELALNARLLDVAGTLTTAAEIHDVERFGWMMSGIALWLFVWGVWMLPRGLARRWPRATWIRTGAASLVLCLTPVYYGEQALIDHLTDNAGGDLRRAAVVMRLLTDSLSKTREDGARLLAISGLDLAGDLLARPEGKTFLALLPFLGASVPCLEDKALKVLDSLLRAHFKSSYGNPDSVYNERFRASVARLAEMYRAYVGLENKFLRRRGSPGSQSRFRAAGRALLARAGVHDSELPFDLDWQKFLASEPIQKAWRRMLSPGGAVALAADQRLAIDISPDALERAYEVRWVEIERRALRSAAKEFEIGGSQEQRSSDAARALFVPPIALFFSLLGALAHIFKFANYSSQFFAWPAPLRLAAVWTLFAGLALSPLALPNDISRSTVFAYFERTLTQRHGPLTGPALAGGTKWVVQAQAYAYPANDFVRRRLFWDWRFALPS